MRQSLETLAINIDTLNSRIKGRGGRRFLAPIPLSDSLLKQLHSNTRETSTLKPDTCSSLNSLALSITLSLEDTRQDFLKVVLPKEEAHHAVSVLRLKEDEAVSIFDPATQIEGLGFLKNTADKNNLYIEVQVLQKDLRRHPALIVGLPKPKTADDLLEKACEIGVSDIYFFVSDHSVSKNLSERDLQNKEERLISIRNSAIKQSYAGHAPQIRLFKDLPSCLAGIPLAEYSKTYFCEPMYYLHLDDPCIRSAAAPQNILSAAVDSVLSPKKTMISIGPEGGFSLQEQKLFLKNNFSLLSLGKNVLRVDTAVAYALAVFGASLPAGTPAEEA